MRRLKGDKVEIVGHKLRCSIPVKQLPVRQLGGADRWTHKLLKIKAVRIVWNLKISHCRLMHILTIGWKSVASVHMYASLYARVWMYVCIHVCVNVCGIYVCVCVHVCVHVHAKKKKKKLLYLTNCRCTVHRNVSWDLHGNYSQWRKLNSPLAGWHLKCDEICCYSPYSLTD